VQVSFNFLSFYILLHFNNLFIIGAKNSSKHQKKQKSEQAKELKQKVQHFVSTMLFHSTVLHTAKANIYLHDAWTEGDGAVLDLADVEQHLAPNGVGFFITPTLLQISLATVKLHQHKSLKAWNFLRIRWY